MYSVIFEFFFHFLENRKKIAFWWQYFRYSIRFIFKRRTLVEYKVKIYVHLLSYAEKMGSYTRHF